MARDTKAPKQPGTEEYAIELFVKSIRPQIESLGCKITTQINLPYANFCDRIDGSGKAIDHGKGKKSYAVDILIYRELENEEKIPLIVIEGKIKSHSSHDAITYSEKARHHKTVFPHLRYGFIVLNAKDNEFKLRYHLHSGFDFEEIFPDKETIQEHDNRVANFLRLLEDQIKIAERKHQIFFKDTSETI